MRDFLNPDRVVIGCDDTATAVRVSELYRSLGAAMLVTDPASAEMIKYASNAFLATKISFINAIANLCEAVDADVREVALGMGYDTRIGFEFLHPGPGYGGSCFPKDTAALHHLAETLEVEFPLLGGVVDVNVEQHERMVDKIRAAAGGELAGRTIAVWGLTFKANTDDLRDSPALSSPGGCSRKAPSCGPTTPRRRPPRPSPRSPASTWWPTRTRCATAPTCWRCSPSGTSSAGSTSTGCASRCRAAVDRRRPQPARPGRDAAPGLRSTRASGADARAVVTGGGRLPRVAPVPALLARG